MRDRGITRPGLKAAIAAAVAVGSATAIVWSAGSIPARNLGIVALVLGSLAMLNYLYAYSLVRQMRRGERVIGSWTVAPATFERFRNAEWAMKQRKNNWRIPRRSRPAGLAVIFTDNAVLVGDTYFQLVAKGISRFTYARIEPGPAASIEFSMTLTLVGAGTLAQTARYRGHLRVPIAEDAHVEAARVAGHFQKLASQ